MILLLPFLYERSCNRSIFPLIPYLFQTFITQISHRICPSSFSSKNITFCVLLTFISLIFSHSYFLSFCLSPIFNCPFYKRASIIPPYIQRFLSGILPSLMRPFPPSFGKLSFLSSFHIFSSILSLISYSLTLKSMNMHISF